MRFTRLKAPPRFVSRAFLPSLVAPRDIYRIIIRDTLIYGDDTYNISVAGLLAQDFQPLRVSEFLDDTMRVILSRICY